MNTVKCLVIRQTGGTAGNSSRGTNFGSVGNPQPATIHLPSGGEYKTTVSHRAGSLQLWAVEFFEAELTFSDLIILTAGTSRGWNIFTEPYEVIGGDVFHTGTTKWLQPDGNRPRVNGGICSEEALRVEKYHPGNNEYAGAESIAAMFGKTSSEVFDLWKKLESISNGVAFQYKMARHFGYETETGFRAQMFHKKWSIA